MTHSLSLIIPTYNSSRHLSRLFDSVQAGSFSGRLEMIVVDDSVAREAATIQDLCCTVGASYHFHQGTIGAKRNYGVEQSSYDIILFVDSDCELTPNSLDQHATLANFPPDVGAMIGLTEFSGTKDYSWEVVQRSQFLGAFSFAKRMEWAPWGTSCNLSVKRRAFASVGGFDPVLFRSEDVDLGLRLNDSGYRIRCNPEALVLHTRDTWRGIRCMMRRVFNYGRGHFRILIKYPGKTAPEFPKFSTITIILTLTIILTSMLRHRTVFLFIPPLFVIVTILLQAFCTLRQSGAHFSGYQTEILGQLLDHSFELGVAYESIRQLVLAPLFRKMVYARQQLIAERERRSIQAWCLLVSLSISVLLFIGMTGTTLP